LNTLTDDAQTAYVNIPATGNISTNDVTPAGTTYGQPAAITGATITVGANGTYTFTATAAGTYTYTVPVCAPGQTTNCPTETLVITVPVNTLTDDAQTAYVNIPATGNISTNDVTPAGTTYGQPAAITGATITVGANGTYTFTATASGTYTYTVPVCAPGQTTNCPTETLVITVPLNTLTDDAQTAYVNIPATGNISTNDVTPAGTTYGQPAAITGATITVGANGTYTFTATAAGTYTYTVPVCAPGQTTNCPTETLVITVTNLTNPITAPDFSVTNVKVPVNGNLSTNDNVPAGTTYGLPSANINNPSGASITINSNGTYTFNASLPGKYIYYVPTCAPGQTVGCPLIPLEITVIDPALLNNKPIVNKDIAITPFNTTTTIDVLANDKAGNKGGLLVPSSVKVAVQPAHGTVTIDPVTGKITYTPTNGYSGNDSVIYNVCDNALPANCQSGVIYITVTPKSASPITIGADDFESAYAGNSISGNVLTNDKNTAGATLTASVVSGPTSAQGLFTLNANGSYTFIPAPGFIGPVIIVYSVCGGTPAVCANATLHLLIEPLIVPKILDVTKIAGTAVMNLDASFDVSFTIKVQNLSKEFLDSVLLKDDLTKVFSDTRGIKVVSVTATGGLVRNIGYDGISNTDLVTITSTLDVNKIDSVILRINVANNTSGNFLNNAVASAPTSYGLVSYVSTDPTRMTVNDTTRKPTPFLIPKIEFKIPEGFSPNFDGVDDAWVILKPFGSKVSVKVFNRWANEVFRSDDYKNDWRGIGVSNFLGADVPEGTYYYIVEGINADGGKIRLAGPLTIKR
jgi:gliding motility-associated-like protein